MFFLFRSSHVLIISDRTGSIFLLDSESSQQKGMMRGAAGSVRSLAVHPSASLSADDDCDEDMRMVKIDASSCTFPPSSFSSSPSPASHPSSSSSSLSPSPSCSSTLYPYVASCGLDRYVRVHHLHTRKLLAKVTKDESSMKKMNPQ